MHWRKTLTSALTQDYKRDRFFMLAGMKTKFITVHKEFYINDVHIIYCNECFLNGGCFTDWGDEVH